MPKKPATRLGVKKRGERWQARPYIPGVGHKWAGTHDTKGEAIEAAEGKVAECYSRPLRQETISSFAARWVRDFPRPKESTNDRYNGDAKRFAAAVDPMDKRRLDEYSVPEAMAYARSRRHDLGALRAMFSDARRIGLVTQNPFAELGIPKGPGRSEITVLTDDELDLMARLAERCHGSRYGSEMYALIVFAAETTMRPGEICGLDRADVDFKAEVVHVRRQFHKGRIQLPKSGKPRKLPYLPPRAAEAIRSLPRRVPAPRCEVTGGEILFPGMEGQRITQSALSGYWKPVRAAFESAISPERLAEFQASGPASLDFYSLRHFGATRMVERGVESWVVAKMMGHEDGGRLVEKVYGHPRDEVAKERLKQAFGQNVAPLRAVEREAEELTG